MQACAPTSILKSTFKPVVRINLQGAKQVTAGQDTYTFSAGQSAPVSRFGTLIEVVGP